MPSACPAPEIDYLSELDGLLADLSSATDAPSAKLSKADAAYSGVRAELDLLATGATIALPDTCKFAASDAGAEGPQLGGSQAIRAYKQPTTPVHPNTALHTGSSSRQKQQTVTRLHVPANQNTTTWRDLRKDQKVAGGMDLAHQLGGWAWSLNLSVKKAQRFELLAVNGNNPLRAFTDELGRQFRNRLGYVPPFACVFEFTSDGKLHLHGVEVRQDQSETHRMLVREALRAAGGKIGGQAGSTQVHQEPLFDGSGWFSYCSKSLRRTRRLLGVENVSFINRELSRLTRIAFDAFMPTKSVGKRRPRLGVSPRQSPGVRRTGASATRSRKTSIIPVVRR